MRIIRTLSEMNETARGWLSAGVVGFVPTMGYFHRGDQALVQAAINECEISVVSIFVNPLQFATHEAYQQYPRNLARDLQLLRTLQVDVVFTPNAEDLYPLSLATYVTPTGPFARRLEAANHPHYARSIATIITKLLQIVRPDVAYFGQKDAQQFAIIRQLVRDLSIDISLRNIPIVRDSDGLALSSRNEVLSPAERREAAEIYQALLTGKAHIDRGERHSLVIKQVMREQLATHPLIRPLYTATCNPDTFVELSYVVPGTLLAIAVEIGNTRLIDNILWRQDGQWQL